MIDIAVDAAEIYSTHKKENFIITSVNHQRIDLVGGGFESQRDFMRSSLRVEVDDGCEFCAHN